MTIDDYLPIEDDSTSPAAMSPAARIGALADAHYERERAADRARARRDTARDNGTAELRAFKLRWAANIDEGARVFRESLRWLKGLTTLREDFIAIADSIERNGGPVGSGISFSRDEECIACALGGGAVVVLGPGDGFAEDSARETIAVLEEALAKAKAALARHVREPSAIRASAENIWNV